MADYSSLKVPELKKLLAEKKLPQTGNKADLIARLQEDEKKNAAPEGETTYDEDDPPKTVTAAAPKPAEEKVPAAEPKSETAPSKTAPSETAHGETAPGETETAHGETAPGETAPGETAPESFALGLASSAAADEAKKRADRAKRFGIDDDEAKKRVERARRFGVDEKQLAAGLDAALPERPLKRGRRGDDGRPGKRQTLDRADRSGHQTRGRRAGSNGPSKGGVLDDPVEKAKAEKRAARFAAT